MTTLTVQQNRIAQYWALTKPRVTQLAVFCAVIGMFLATPGLPDWPVLISATIGIWLLAGAAFAVNCLVEREIDSRMARTARRPLARGEITVPQTLLFIPLAQIIRNFELGDTPWSLILTYPTFLIPFCTWLMMGYFKAIPKELEECARIDGASRWKAMVYIIIPCAVPGILSAGIIAFTLSWNEFIYALVFLSSPDQKTVAVGVTSELIRGDVFFWGPLMAGALLGSIPVAIVYSFFVEHYVSGLTGSVKG